MSRNMASGSLTEVKVEHKRRHTQGPELQITKLSKVSTMSQPEFFETQKSGYGTGKQLKSDFVYVNSAYVGSVDNVNNERRLSTPPTSVIREQYCVCARWPYTQRILALAVGVLLGTVIGLIVIVVLRGADKDLMPGFLLRKSAPD